MKQFKRYRMKRSIRTFAILILMVSMHVSGQDFQGTAVYESKKNLRLTDYGVDVSNYALAEFLLDH